MTRRRTNKKRGKVVERRRPAPRKRDFNELWFLPLLCAIVAIATLVIVQGLGMRLRLAIVTATCSGVLPVVVLIGALLVKEFMPEIETVTRLDLNRDGVIGDPNKATTEATPPVIQANTPVRGVPVAEQTTHDVSNAGRRHAMDLVEVIQRGQMIGYKQKAWLGQTLNSGNKVSQPVFAQIVKELKAAKILVGGRGQETKLAANLTADEALRMIFHPD